jgi:pimeloyl-ACP methyl ester carboxylesterase
MLARLLIFTLSVELGLYFVAGVWICSHLGVPVIWSMPFAVFAVLLTDAMLIAWSFVLAHRYAAAAPACARLTNAGKLRLFLNEFLAFAALYTLLQPLERWIVRPPPAGDAGRADQAPVLLVPGIYCNAGLWWWMRRRLRARGLGGIWAVTVEPPLADIDQLARHLSMRIAQVCEATHAHRVVLVTHSMGGLIARACLRDSGTCSRIAKIVSLAAPYHGSKLARWAVGLDGRQLRPGNAWLEALNASDPRVPTVSLFSWHDNIVAPQDSPILAHATNVPLTGIGHLSLVFSEAVAQRVYEEILSAPQM